MAEIPGAPHSDECAHATGTICVCSCRGAMHGVAHSGSGSPLIRRMAEVTVNAAHDVHNVNGAKVGTPAERRRHPVTVTVVQTDLPDGGHPVNTGPEVTHTTSRVPADLSGVSDDDLMQHFAAAAEAGSDHDAQRIFDEMGRREEVQAAAARYKLPKPVHDMSDVELGQAAHDAGGDEHILGQVFDEMDRRQAEADKRAQAAKTPPAAPALVTSGIYSFEQLRGQGLTADSNGDGAQIDRVRRAERLAVGVDQDAPEAEFLAAARADPRSAEDRSAWALAWYRKLAEADGIGPRDQAYGPSDNPAMVAERDHKAAAAAAEEARQAALGTGPAGPAQVRNPIAAWGDVTTMAHGYRDQKTGRLAQERIQEAQRRVLGLDPAADEKTIRAAERVDSRSAPQRAAEYLGWYRHLGQHSDLGTTTPADWVRGPADEPGAVNRPALAPANVAKPWDTWQQIKDQAKSDQAAGDPATYDRYVMAMRHAYGMPDDAAPGEIGNAFRHDQRTQNQQAAVFLAHFRELADAAGVDASDTMRHGPLDRNAGRSKSLPTQWKETNPAQEKQLDELLSRGWDYLDAYAEVHNLDPAQLKAQQAAGAVDKRAGEATEQAVRRQYDEHVHLAYVAAEGASRGHLLNKAGQAAKIDPMSLFSGPTARARKYASEDLLRWWADNPRMTYQQFRGHVLGRASDKAAGKVTAMAAQGKDFG